MAQTNGELEHSKGMSSPAVRISQAQKSTKLTVDPESPEQVANGTHAEGEQPEENAGGMLFPRGQN